MPSEHLADLRDALETRADPSTPAEIVLLFDETPAPSALEAARSWIDEAFAADTVPGIIERLRERSEPDASAAADTLEELSPTALTVTLEAVRRARASPDLRAALAQEYGLVLWFAATQPDLLEACARSSSTKTARRGGRPRRSARSPRRPSTRPSPTARPSPLWTTTPLWDAR